MKSQKRNRGARKMNLFTTMHWWNFEVMIHETSVVKKIHFSSTSMVHSLRLGTEKGQRKF